MDDNIRYTGKANDFVFTEQSYKFCGICDDQELNLEAPIVEFDLYDAMEDWPIDKVYICQRCLEKGLGILKSSI